MQPVPLLPLEDYTVSTWSNHLLSDVCIANNIYSQLLNSSHLGELSKL